LLSATGAIFRTSAQVPHGIAFLGDGIVAVSFNTSPVSVTLHDAVQRSECPTTVARTTCAPAARLRIEVLRGGNSVEHSRFSIFTAGAAGSA
jgi:hypothetical protein